MEMQSVLVSLPQVFVPPWCDRQQARWIYVSKQKKNQEIRQKNFFGEK